MMISHPALRSVRACMIVTLATNAPGADRPVGRKLFLGIRMTRAAELSRELEQAAREVLDIRPLSRTQPHAFCEDKDAAYRKLMKVAADLRTVERHSAFNGPRGQFRTGRVVVASKRHVGREVRVETRRAAA